MKQLKFFFTFILFLNVYTSTYATLLESVLQSLFMDGIPFYSHENRKDYEKIKSKYITALDTLNLELLNTGKFNYSTFRIPFLKRVTIWHKTIKSIDKTVYAFMPGDVAIAFILKKMWTYYNSSLRPEYKLNLHCN